uniref:Candidate secreted effector n=1 Tax=Meloidogyne incognita TaxID=6306 RepID=A0A914M9P6_MELIC
MDNNNTQNIDLGLSKLMDKLSLNVETAQDQIQELRSTVDNQNMLIIQARQQVHVLQETVNYLQNRITILEDRLNLGNRYFLEPEGVENHMDFVQQDVQMLDSDTDEEMTARRNSADAGACVLP